MAALGDDVKTAVADVNKGGAGGWAMFKVQAGPSITIAETGTGFAALAAKLQAGVSKTAVIKLESGGASKLVFVRFASGDATTNEQFTKAATFLKNTLGGGNSSFVQVDSAAELTEASVTSKAF